MALTREEVKIGTIFEHRTGYLAVVTGPYDSRDGTYEVKPLTTGGSDYVRAGEKRWVRPKAMVYAIYQPEEAKEVKAAADKSPDKEKVELELGGVKVAMTYRQFEKFVKSFGKY